MTRFTFDTNVLVYAADREAGPRHAVAVDLVARAADRDCVLALQVLGEFANVAFRRLGSGGPSVNRLVLGWMDLFPVFPATGATLRSALEAAHRHRLSFWDAMLWMTAAEAGCRLLLSEDLQDGRTLRGVTIVNPFARANSAAMENLLQ